MAEKLHNLSEKLPDDNGSASHPSGASAQPPTPPPPDTTDFGHGPVTGSAQITAMNVDDARLAVEHLRSARDDLEQARKTTRVLIAIKPPGQEPASHEYAKNANANGAKHDEACRQLINNISAEIANLEAAIKQVVGNEDSTSSNFRKLT